MQTWIIFISNITSFCLPVISEAPWPLVPWFLPPCLGLSPSCYRGSSGREPRQSPHAGPSSLTTSLSSCKSWTKKNHKVVTLSWKDWGIILKLSLIIPIGLTHGFFFLNYFVLLQRYWNHVPDRHLENLGTVHLKRIVTWVSLPSFELRDDQEASQRSFWGSRAARSSSTRSCQPSSSRLRRPKRRQRNLKPPLNSNFLSQQ